MKKLVYLVLVMMLHYSCVFNSDIELKTENKKVTASIGVPLAKGEFKLSSILPENDPNIKPIGEKGLYAINIPNIDPVAVSYAKASDLFTMPSTVAPAPLSVDLPVGASGVPLVSPIHTRLITTPVTLWNDSRVVVSKLDLDPKSAQNYVEITASVPLSEYTIIIKSAVLNGANPLHTFTENKSNTFRYDMQGKSLDLAQEFKFEVEIKAPAGATKTSSQGKIEVSFSTGSFEVKTIHGKFDALSIDLGDISGKKFPVDMPDFEDYQDIFDNTTVTDLKLDLVSKSTLGIDAGFKFEINYTTRKNDTKLLGKADINLPKAALGDTATVASEVKIDEIGLNLSTIEFSDVDLKLGNTPGFITFPLLLEIAPKFTLPLNVKMNNISYSTFSELDVDIDQMKSGTLKFNYANQLSLDVEMVTYLIKSGVRTDSVKVLDENGKETKLLSNTGLDANNKPNWKKVDVVMGESFTKALPDADSLEFALQISTLNDKGELESLTIDSTKSFGINVSVLSELTINIDEQK